MHFKPEGYNAVSPYLTVNGAQSTIDFLVRVFGATRLRTIHADDGKIAHGEVRIDDSVLMFTDATEGWPAVPAHVHVYVAGVDATYARALETGAIGVQEPVQKDDADKRGGFQDAGGTTWWWDNRSGRSRQTYLPALAVPFALPFAPWLRSQEHAAPKA